MKPAPRPAAGRVWMGRAWMGLGLAGLLGVLLIDCGDPSLRPGRPEFFERVMGLAFEPGEPRIECHRGRRVGRAALYLWDLSGEVLTWFSAPPASFREHPLLDGRPEGRELQTWRTGVASEDEEVDMTAQAITSVYWVLGGDCDGAPDFKTTIADLRATLARESTHYSMITLPQHHDSLVMQLYVVDPVAAQLYVIEANP